MNDIGKRPNWHKYPNEEPKETTGEYLCRGISVCTNTLHYYVCRWIIHPDMKGFFFDGNEFESQMKHHEFEWVSVKEFS